LALLVHSFNLLAIHAHVRKLRKSNRRKEGFMTTRRFLPFVVFSLLASFASAEQFTDKIEKSYPVPAGGALNLRADYGSVEVHPADVNEVKVTVERRVEADTKQEAQQIFDDFSLEPVTTGNTLELRGRFKTGWERHDWNDHGNRNWNMCTSQLISDDGSETHNSGSETYCLKYARELREHKYIITIPRKLSLFVRTEAGHVSVDGDVNGEAEIRTAGGHVSIGNVSRNAKITTAGGHITAGNIGGPATLTTAGGHIKVGNVNGDLRAETAGGHIESGYVRGNVKATTAGGHINIERADGAIVASTVGGRIRAVFGAQPTQDSRLQSMSGGVDVQLPSAVKLDVAVESRGGGLSSDFPLTMDASDSDRHVFRDASAHGKLNGGGPKLEIRSSMGSVHLTKSEL
jgi:hypothetical protein